MISSQNVLRHELIGLDILVVGAHNPLHRGLTGCIVDETRNLLILETKLGIKRIPKKGSLFQVRLYSGELVEIDGSVMILAPEKRINLQMKRIT
jgi:ribonuclease P protein subunit POP4